MVAGLFELSVYSNFSSAHSLRGYEGDCERIHGHNWKVEAVVACKALDDLGLGLDFKELKLFLKQVVDRLDHEHLNDISPFDEINPSSENLARHIFCELEKLLPERVSVKKVRVWESESASASYMRE